MFPILSLLKSLSKKPLIFLALMLCGMACNRQIHCPENASLEEEICICDPGYFGENCGEFDACLSGDTECHNGGTCNSGECECSWEWSGEHCEVYTMSTLNGQWNVVEHEGNMINQLMHFEIETSQQGGHYAKLYYPPKGSTSQDFADVWTNEKIQDEGANDAFVFYFNEHKHGYNTTSFSLRCVVKNDSIFGSGEMFRYPPSKHDHTKLDLRTIEFTAVRN